MGREGARGLSALRLRGGWEGRALVAGTGLGREESRLAKLAVGLKNKVVGFLARVGCLRWGGVRAEQAVGGRWGLGLEAAVGGKVLAEGVNSLVVVSVINNESQFGHPW